MIYLSRRSLSSLLRSGFNLRGDLTAAAVSCSSLFSDADGGIKKLHSRAGNAVLWRNSQLCSSQGSFFGRGGQVSGSVFRCFCSGSDTSPPSLDRKFLAQLWVADKKKLKAMEKRYKKASKHRNYTENDGFDVHFETVEPTVEQPPVSQSMSGLLKPKTSDEAKIATLLARSNLLVTRDIEWANLVLGFEQENRYIVVDVCYPEAPVGSIREQSNLLARQLLRTRRPFVASITDALGNELFRVRRPFWWLTSSIYAEIDGEEIGVVHRRWHLWRRIYDLYLGNNQFAVVENPGFWNWTFTVKDADGEVLAQIDRDWRGFGFEIFTDAGQYVIRFGKADAAAKTGPATLVEELEVKRPLTLSERAVVLTLAISLDNDYFSRHGGWGIPFMAVIMGDFSIQISSKLINQLAEGNDQPKRRAKKTKPKVSPQSKQKTNQDEEKKPNPVAELPMQPPFFFPIPPQGAASTELESIKSVVKESEKVLEKLELQEKNIVREVTERAKDLREKEFKIPEPKPMPCSSDHEAWMKCYKENIGSPLKCSGFVKSFQDCARRSRQQVNPEEK